MEVIYFNLPLKTGQTSNSGQIVEGLVRLLKISKDGDSTTFLTGLLSSLIMKDLFLRAN